MAPYVLPISMLKNTIDRIEQAAILKTNFVNPYTAIDCLWYPKIVNCDACIPRQQADHAGIEDIWCRVRHLEVPLAVDFMWLQPLLADSQLVEQERMQLTRSPHEWLTVDGS